MRPNLTLEALRQGTPVVSAWMNTRDPLIAEALSVLGFDAVTIDMQHGVAGSDTLLGLLQAVSAGRATPLVRVPWNRPEWIMRALDLGAYGVIAPMIRTVDDVEGLVSACRYPPQGTRSQGPIRAALYGGPDYGRMANEHVMAIPMIETREALDDLDALLGVEGVDMVFVGPSDLSQAVGGPPGADFTDGPGAEAVAHVLDRCKAHGVPAGLFCRDPHYARRALASGFGFVTVLPDLSALTVASREALEVARGERP